MQSRKVGCTPPFLRHGYGIFEKQLALRRKITREEEHRASG